MKEIVVLSAKGGTGKTTIVGSFAVLAQNKVLVDCDVDAADLYLLLEPKARETHDFQSGQTAYIDEEKCTQCELCEDVCRFEAIRDLHVDPLSCEGCGFCAQVCPADAIAMQQNLAGQWFISDTKYGALVHARLGIAQENPGRLVAEVRRKAKLIAEAEGLNYIISDGPPGIGCPVISSLSGVNLALLNLLCQGCMIWTGSLVSAATSGFPLWSASTNTILTRKTAARSKASARNKAQR